MNQSNNKYKRLRKRKVFEDVADMIRDMVESGTLSPGDQLPPERELAEKL